MFHVQNMEMPMIPARSRRFPRVGVGAPSVEEPIGVGAVMAVFCTGFRKRRSRDAILAESRPCRCVSHVSVYLDSRRIDAEPTQSTCLGPNQEDVEVDGRQAV